LLVLLLIGWLGLFLGPKLGQTKAWGSTVKKPIYKKLWFQIVAGLFVIGAIGNIINPDQTVPQSGPEQTSSSSEALVEEGSEKVVESDENTSLGSEQTEDASAKENATDTSSEFESKDPEVVVTPATTSELKFLIDSLEVASEVSSGYNRDLFKHWTDADGDGCNARYEVLIQETLAPLAVSSGCKLSGGSWVSAFDLVETNDPSKFDVDHMVPLKEAWDSGAWAWDAKTREAYANDLDYEMSLIAVSASSNRSKSDRDPADWLPTNQDYWCEYITAWVQVKTRWSLSMDKAEKARVEDVAEDCSGEELEFAPKAATATAAPAPTKTATPSPSPTPTETKSSTPAPTPTPTPSQTASGNCGPGQVDLNTASVDELKLIKYIDVVRAPLVIELRPFNSVDQLINVKGIGPTYLQRIKDEGIACVN